MVEVINTALLHRVFQHRASGRDSPFHSEVRLPTRAGGAARGFDVGCSWSRGMTLLPWRRPTGSKVYAKTLFGECDVIQASSSLHLSLLLSLFRILSLASYLSSSLIRCLALPLPLFLSACLLCFPLASLCRPEGSARNTLQTTRFCSTHCTTSTTFFFLLAFCPCGMGADAGRPARKEADAAGHKVMRARSQACPFLGASCLRMCSRTAYRNSLLYVGWS